MIRVSVVVPTYKRPELLGRCLDALLRQDFNPAHYEIIVADDAECDDTCRQVQCLTHCHGLRPLVSYVPVCRKHGHGPAAARNAGWRLARGEIIAFTDDDCVPDAYWLAAGVAAFEGDIAGVSGKIVVPVPECPTDYQLSSSHLEASRFVTANCFYRRDVLEALAGFDERFETAWREDCDLHFRCVQAGHRLVTCDDALVIHPVRRAAWGVSVGQQRKSMFNALLYKKHPRLYRERVQAAPPWRYYAIVAALVTAIGMLIAGRKKPGALAGLIWLLLSGRFCSQRLAQTSHATGHVAEMIVTSAVIPPLAIFWRLRGAIKFRVFFL